MVRKTIVYTGTCAEWLMPTRRKVGSLTATFAVVENHDGDEAYHDDTTYHRCYGNNRSWGKLRRGRWVIHCKQGK
ncbi:hypothetical protein DPMN_121410 [Dreissena polymorpha]|uniref:Uncharacterized protein n=1 Tax=Dreissena polymorpha TaxID=45954 RepID=A0A9D4GMP4_DREPO|nr:hypothetical protein DPMN_121410 [Dreissena polymorpha]